MIRLQTCWISAADDQSHALCRAPAQTCFIATLVALRLPPQRRHLPGTQTFQLQMLRLSLKVLSNRSQRATKLRCVTRYILCPGLFRTLCSSLTHAHETRWHRFAVLKTCCVLQYRPVAVEGLMCTDALMLFADIPTNRWRRCCGGLRAKLYRWGLPGSNGALRHAFHEHSSWSTTREQSWVVRVQEVSTVL